MYKAIAVALWMIGGSIGIGIAGGSIEGMFYYSIGIAVGAFLYHFSWCKK